MNINSQAELAYNFVQFTDKNVFLTGKAGTGKTTFLHRLKSSSFKRMAIVAPTGVAAINAGGVTIHSLFQMPFGPYIAQSVSGNRADVLSQHQRKFSKDKIKLIQGLELLVIDEISMVRADLLDGIDEVLRRYKDRHKPFGGVQLLMIGDLHQLSPVVREDDWSILKSYYPNLYFFSSKALQTASPVCIELKHIYRQSDTYFIDILNKIRENKIDPETLKELNSRYIPQFKPQDEEGYITLTTHNYAAQDINTSKLKEIKGKSQVFRAEITGDFPEYSYPTPIDLELKIGAQVMFVKNDPSRDKLFYNGKIGKITKIDSPSIYVKCPGDTFEIEVRQTEWENIKYELNPESKEVEEKVIGSFTQYPLKLAWAITIHKSQGLTFEKAIIDATDSFAHGQVYVALSRCKSFEGMVLRSPIHLHSVKTDHTVSSYTKKVDEQAPGETNLTEAKTAFQQSLLLELFDFKNIKSRFFLFKKLVEENYNILLPQLHETLEALKEMAEKDIYQVSDTFRRELQKLLTQNELPETNLPLQERVKKACAYFFTKVENDFYQKMLKTSIETDNSAVRKTLSEATDNLKKELFIKLAVLKSSLDGFETISYLKTRANAEIDYSAAPKLATKSANEVPSEIPNPQLYSIIKKWRNALAQENGIPVYIVLPTKALVELVTVLPSTSAELEMIKGIGKQKVKQYGEELLSMINNYCFVNKIERSALNIPARETKTKTDTKKLSLDLFKSGKSISEIAAERGLTVSTIEGHLTQFIKTGEIDVSDLINKDKLDRIIAYFSENNTSSTSQAKEALGEDVSWGELRAAMEYLKSGDKTF